MLNTLLGGATSFWGPIVGAFAFAFVGFATRTFAGISEIMIGATLLAVVLVAPEGILGFLRKLEPGAAGGSHGWPRKQAAAPGRGRHADVSKLIEVAGLSKSYGAHLVLKNVDFDVNDGEGFAIIGPNGAGKTTLFKALTGEIFPNAGFVRFGGDDVTTLPAHRAHPRRVRPHVPGGARLPRVHRPARTLSSRSRRA